MKETRKKEDAIWTWRINWPRLACIFPVMAFVLCFIGMIWNFIDLDFNFGVILATAAAVNVWAFVAIWKNTEVR
jgi:hypothetical protein